MQEIKSKARTQKIEQGKPDRKLNLFDPGKFATLHQGEFTMTFELVTQVEKEVETDLLDENGNKILKTELVEEIEEVDFVARYQTPGDTLITNDEALVIQGIKYNDVINKIAAEADGTTSTSDVLTAEERADFVLSERDLMNAMLLQCVVDPLLTKDTVDIIPYEWKKELVAEISKGVKSNTQMVSSFRKENKR